jgi:putative ABC transport system permease protein
MLKNFIRIALRNLFKHKVFSFINIFGLAIGIAASLLIFQYARFELSYDRFQANAGRIFRLQIDRYNEGRLAIQWAAGPAGIGPIVKDAFPEIASLARLRPAQGVISYKDQEFRETGLFYANDDFLPMFSYPALAGSTHGALSEVFTAVLTNSAAKKYFGSEDPIGKLISVNKKDNFKVTAIIPDPPANTHLKFSILLSFATMQKWHPEINTTMGWDGWFAYLLLRPGTEPQQLEKKIAALVQTNWGDDMKKSKYGMVFHLQALPDIHLHSNFMHEAEVNGDGKAVYFLLVIAVFIIVIAWINYINLATARSIERAKEVGIRKTLGSHRRQLIIQFLLESFLINLLAAAAAFVLILLFLPLFNTLTGKSLTLSLLGSFDFWSNLALLFITGTILSGVYPALVLSSFKPIAVLKGRLKSTTHGSFLRHSLVIAQFAASVLLMVGTFTVYRQLHFMQHQDLGVQVDQTLVIRGPNVLDSTYDNMLSNFHTEVLRIPGIGQFTASTEVPGNKVGWNAGGIRLVGADETKSRQYRIIGIDYDFLDTYGLKLLKGRNFSRNFSTDSGAVLFNEAAVQEMGYRKPEDVLGKRIEFWGKQYTIVGIVTNHHQESLRENYDAHIFRLIPDAGNYYSLKLTGNHDSWTSTIAAIKNQYKKFFPDNPFDYFFLDNKIADQYKADQQFGQTFGVFAGLAIFVSCLGLLGLASFVTTQRTKEIGIRKIAGAGVSSILLLLTRDFLRPVLLSFLIATPLTWFVLEKWLDNYAFRIALTPWMFVAPILLILLVALVTITTQTLQAATSSPVKSLRSE